MALVLADRVLETCTSPGAGGAVLLGASTGYQSFSSAIGDGNTCYYCIADQGGANWEVGLGTYNSSGNTLTRTTPISGSSTTPVNFSSGTQNVFVTYPAEKSVNLDASGKIRADSNNYLDFASAAPSKAAGRMWYNDTTGTWNLVMGGGNITQQVGEEQFIYGQASGAISGETTLQLIFKTGVDTGSGTLKFAPTTSGITDSGLMLGVATEDISADSFGRISTFGIIHGVDTTGSTYSETWTNGDVVWYNPTTGGLTKTKPTAPNIKYQVGTVVVASSSGAFQVQLAAGSVLGGTDSNVQFGTLSSTNLLQYNGTYWTNVTPGSITGIGSVANAVTFNNSGTGAASGTTFDGSVTRTISYNTIGAQPSGTYVTSVTGTSPVASSGGTTPAISLSSGYGDTQNPYASKTAKYFLAAPNASSGVPSFRAIVASDIPTLNQDTTGTATTAINLSGGTVSATSGSFSSTLTCNSYLLAAASFQEHKTAIAASNIDMSVGNYFSKTIAATTTFTVSNVPTTGTAMSFILDLTNGGSQTINWWTGVKWAGGTAPTLTTTGRDILGFFTYDGGTTWNGLLLAKDIK